MKDFKHYITKAFIINELHIDDEIATNELLQLLMEELQGGENKAAKFLEVLLKQKLITNTNTNIKFFTEAEVQQACNLIIQNGIWATNETADKLKNAIWIPNNVNNFGKPTASILIDVFCKLVAEYFQNIPFGDKYKGLQAPQVQQKVAV